MHIYKNTSTILKNVIHGDNNKKQNSLQKFLLVELQ